MSTFAADREVWELSKNVTRKSKNKMAIGTFKLVKLTRTNGIVPALFAARS
jgi:hypothetical protein